MKRFLKYDTEIIKKENSPVDKNGLIKENIVGGGSSVQPDWNQNDETAADYVKNRPFYTGNPVETVMLPETTITITAGNENLISSSFPYSFELGKTYIITFDGVDTEYTAYEAEGFVVIGYDYSSVAGGSGYVVMNGNGAIALATLDTSLDGSHTIAIKGYTQEIIKIDEKYLPDDLTSEISTLSSDVSTLSNDVNTLSSDVSTLSNDVSTLSSDVSTKMDKTNPTGSGSFNLNRKANTTIGEYSFAEGYGTTASSKCTHAEGYATTASGYSSHSEGTTTTALGHSAHSEGGSSYKYSSFVTVENPTDEDIITAWKTNKFSVAKGSYSHIEGNNSLALGEKSHAEGYETIASSDCSHAEGYATTASGEHSHAEGFRTIASGCASHAEGYETIASSNYQHVQGKFNIEDSSGTYANIVGNGFSDVRSNAHTLDWDGNAWYAGTVEGKALILPSSTTGSTKKFKITVDDSGTITATEVS